MLYQREIEDSVLIQFIILFTLYNSDTPLSYADLINIDLETCNIKFTDFQVSLYNLKTTDHVRAFMVSQHVEMYEITDKGKNVSDFFKQIVPVYIREPILDAIKQHFLDKRRKEAVRSAIVPINTTDYRTECSLYDDDKTQLLELNIFVGPRDEAEKMAKHFKKHYEEIYETIVRLMSYYDKDDEDDDKSELFIKLKQQNEKNSSVNDTAIQNVSDIVKDLTDSDNIRNDMSPNNEKDLSNINNNAQLDENEITD